MMDTVYINQLLWSRRMTVISTNDINKVTKKVYDCYPDDEFSLCHKYGYRI